MKAQKLLGEDRVISRRRRGYAIVASMSTAEILISTQASTLH